MTYALGSCIAVMIHDPVRKIGGMIHYMLPLSAVTPDRSRRRPAMFADTGIPLLLERMYALYCRKSDLTINVAGGERIQDDSNYFEIGKRNYLALRLVFLRRHACLRRFAGLGRSHRARRVSAV